MKKFNYDKCMADIKEGIDEALQQGDGQTFIVMCAFKEILEKYCEEEDECEKDI